MYGWLRENNQLIMFNSSENQTYNTQGNIKLIKINNNDGFMTRKMWSY